MGLNNILLIVTWALTILFAGDSVLTGHTPPPTSKRIKFHIVTVEERFEGRKVLSESVVEGPPNTDFNITLEEGGFRLRAWFLIDLIRPEALRMRAKLDTRRLYGSSDRSLPLYEEDEYVSKTIFRPLGMTTATFVPDRNTLRQTATPYNKEG